MPMFGKCGIFFKYQDNKLICDNKSGKTYEVNDCSNILLFFNRSDIKTPEFNRIQRQTKVGMKTLSLFVSDVTNSNISSDTTYRLHNCQLTSKDILHILELRSWLNSREIDFYMQVIVATSEKKVHAVNCDWFNQSLYCGENVEMIRGAILKPQSSKCPWFSYDWVLVPVNISGPNPLDIISYRCPKLSTTLH